MKNLFNMYLFLASALIVGGIVATTANVFSSTPFQESVQRCESSCLERSGVGQYTFEDGFYSGRRNPFYRCKCNEGY